MAVIGFSGTSGFVGEFLSLACIYEASSWVAFVCTTGIILGAAYMLYLYRRVVFGELTKDDVKAMPDLTAREWTIMVPLAAVALWMGVYHESRSEEHTSELQSLMRISYAVFCLKKTTTHLSRAQVCRTLVDNISALTYEWYNYDLHI